MLHSRDSGVKEVVRFYKVSYPKSANWRSQVKGLDMSFIDENTSKWLEILFER